MLDVDGFKDRGYNVVNINWRNMLAQSLGNVYLCQSKLLTTVNGINV